MQRMEAVLLTGHGEFEMLEHRTDVPVPRPGPGEVLIRVRAAGVNNTDINTRIGWYSESMTAGTARFEVIEAKGGILPPEAPGLGITVNRNVLGAPVQVWGA